MGYAYVVRAVGGTSTYFWSITGGALPAGLTLNPSSGLVSGVAHYYGLGQVTIRVQDGTGSSSRALAWEVTAASSWAQEAHDAGSSSSAPGERTMTPGNVAAAGLEWRMPEENPSDVVVGGVLYSGVRSRAASRTASRPATWVLARSCGPEPFLVRVRATGATGWLWPARWSSARPRSR